VASIGAFSMIITLALFFSGDKGFSTEGKNNHKACVVVRSHWLLSTTVCVRNVALFSAPSYQTATSYFLYNCFQFQHLRAMFFTFCYAEAFMHLKSLFSNYCIILQFLLSDVVYMYHLKSCYKYQYYP
jgi:hypothetical protein